MFKRAATIVVVLTIALATFFLIPSKKVQAGIFGMSVILVHGWNAQNKIDCNNGNEFGGIKSFFINNGWGTSTQPVTRSVGWYNQDLNCDNLLNTKSFHCTGWFDSGSNDGTVNEDLRHVSCELAWYIWDGYTSKGGTVGVIGHSMGGIIIRQAMNDTPYIAAFPPYLRISDVATAGTPHQGLTDGAALFSSTSFIGCALPCTQVAQMERSNAMMSNMNSVNFRGGFARNPQGNGGTDWTTMSSNNDEVLQRHGQSFEELGSPLVVTAPELCGLMPGARHFVIYPGPSPAYNHGGYLIDSSSDRDANEIFSDDNGTLWFTSTTSAHSIFTMYEAILLSTW
jgi:hypothetical protein